MKRGKDSRAAKRPRHFLFSQNGAERQRHTHSVVKAWKWGAHRGYTESSRGSLQELRVSQLRAVAMLLTARDGRGGSTTCESPLRTHRDSWGKKSYLHVSLEYMNKTNNNS